ncbi:MAG: 2-dehydropantoate 2-reductase [Spirochaetes bacterium]|nr:2-dehydropantoate 2-reductase [Spirochaetota bacterium]
MDKKRISIIGIGATGAVLAAALLKQNPDVMCIDTKPGLDEALAQDGINISGAISIQTQVKNFSPSIKDLKKYSPDLIFISTKTYHLNIILKEIEEIYVPGIKIISTHNGFGTEDVIAEKFGPESAFRMSLNMGASIKDSNNIEVAFFNKPNYLGALNIQNNETGLIIADMFTKSGVDTEYVDDIKHYVWRKMITKSSLAAICAVTDMTIKDVMEYPPTREIALGCFNEAIAVAAASGYDLGSDFLDNALAYLDKVGSHKDSMCYDVENKLPTEIDFLGQKVVDYGVHKGIPTPYTAVMTNLVKTMEKKYLY